MLTAKFRVFGTLSGLLILLDCSSPDKQKKPSDLSIEEEAVHTMTLSGYPDFLAVDGREVWVTNADTVQKLSTASAIPILAAVAPGACGAPIVAFGSLWVASCKDNVVLRLDKSNGEIQSRIRCSIADPEGEISLAAGAGSIWVLSDARGVLSRIDPATNQVIAEIPVLSQSFCAVFGFAAVWITNTGDNSVQRINPATNQVAATISVGPTPRFLASGAGGIWTLNQGDGTVTRIDPQTNSVIATIACEATGTGGDIDAGDTGVWVRAKKGRMLQVIDPATNQVDRIFGPLNGSGAVRIVGDQVWVTAHDVNKVWVVR